MHLELGYLAGAVLVGIGATVIMDLWNLLLRRAFNISSLNFCLVGRWLGYMPLGTFKHANIGAAARRPGECVLGWSAHYAIGIAFALMLVLLTSGGWLMHPTLLPALLVGIGTVPIPYFIVQPALGLGMASANTPRPTQARLKSLMTHTVYGVGLYVSAVPVSMLMRVFA